jgi:two-component system CheB/CheR fusion protein
MAFVLVPHLDPSHASLLTEILQRATTMPVVEAQPTRWRCARTRLRDPAQPQT